MTGRTMNFRPSDLPRHDQPISERFRLVAKAWSKANSAAEMLEESKSAFLSQKMMALGDMPVNRAELQVKASPEWADYIKSMVEAREEANTLKVQMEFIRMQFSEWQSTEATARAERRM